MNFPSGTIPLARGSYIEIDSDGGLVWVNPSGVSSSIPAGPLAQDVLSQLQQAGVIPASASALADPPENT